MCACLLNSAGGSNLRCSCRMESILGDWLSMIALSAMMMRPQTWRDKVRSDLRAPCCEFILHTIEALEANGRLAAICAGGIGCRGLRIARKPTYEAVLEFLRSCRDCAAMVGARNFPKSGLRILITNKSRVSRGNIAVDFAVDQQDGHIRLCDKILWRDLLHVEAVFPTGAQKCNLNQRS